MVVRSQEAPTAPAELELLLFATLARGEDPARCRQRSSSIAVRPYDPLAHRESCNQLFQTPLEREG